MASAEVNNKDYIAAERDYREALRVYKKNKDNEGIAVTTSHIAWFAFKREKWAKAESLAREALVKAEKFGRQELIAYDCHRLGIALLKQSESRSRFQRDVPSEDEKSRQRRDLQEALTLSSRAVEVFSRLRHPDLQSAQETLAEIEKAVG